MNETPIAYKVGDVVDYLTTGNRIRRVTVTAREPFNGTPGFDGIDVLDGAPIWGRDHQIFGVVESV